MLERIANNYRVIMSAVEETDESSAVVFGRIGCVWTQRAIARLQEAGYSVKVAYQDSDSTAKDGLRRQYGRPTVPFIWYNGAYVGGHDELVRRLS